MKKLFFSLFFISLFLSGTVVLAQTSISSADKQEVADSLEGLVQAINEGNTEKIATFISPDNLTLQSEVQDSIRGGVAYELDYSPLDSNTEIISNSEIKVKGKFSASGVGWNVSGLSVYFLFEKTQNQQWLITDTDFHKKIGFNYTSNYLKKIFIIIGPIILVLTIFWVWMLIDCIKRNFDNKELWVILLLLLYFIGAILYFFIIKRKNITREPLRFYE